MAIALVPTKALADACDKERPLWNPATGPATALNELVYLATLPVSLTLLALAALALAMRLRSLLIIAAVLWGGLSVIIVWDNFGPVLDDVRWLAMEEGCIGPSYLFIALAIAICAGMTFGALRPRN